MKEVYDFLKKCGTYYLATVEGDQPRVRPFGTVDLFNGRLYIQTGLKKNIARQLSENPKAEICAFMDGCWLRIAATLVLDDNREARVHMLNSYPELKTMYDPDDGNTAVYYLSNATATFNSFSEPPKEINF